MARSTHTYVTMEVSPSTFREIEEKLRAADYLHCIHAGPEGVRLDMQGIAIVLAEKTPENPPPAKTREQIIAENDEAFRRYMWDRL